MEKLPPELVLDVFSRLVSKVDLANLRLVQRDFAELGARFMFSVINIQPTYTGLLPLLDVSHRRHLACHVKKVVLHLEDYRRLIWIPLKKKLRSGAGAQSQNRRKFEEEVKEIEEFQVSSDYTALLSSSFCRLSNLESLQIQEMSSVGYLDQKSSSEMVDYGLENERLYLYREGARLIICMGIYRAFYALITAAYLSDVKLVSFQSNARRLFHGSAFEYKELVERCRVVFQHCRILDLELPQKGLRDRGPAVGPSGLIDPFYIILSATQLEKLSLKFITESFGIARDADIIFIDILKGLHVWTCLKELKLENIVIPDIGILPRFLRRHHSTLRRLSLQDCELSEGSWIDVVKGIKQTCGLGLVTIKLGSLLDHSVCSKTPHWHHIRICLGRIYSEEELADMLNMCSQPVTSRAE